MKQKLIAEIGMVFSLIITVLLAHNAYALSIITDNSNSTINSISYDISLASVNLTSQGYLYIDNGTVINSTIYYTTIYECSLGIISNETKSYNNTGILNITSTIINQSIDNLTDGIYNLTAVCIYNISEYNNTIIFNQTSNATNINNTSNTNNTTNITNTTNTNNTTNITNTSNTTLLFTISNNSSKKILVDTIMPSINLNYPLENIIDLSNQTNASTYDIKFNFSVYDANLMGCSLNLSDDSNYTLIDFINSSENQTDYLISETLYASNDLYNYAISCYDILNNTNTTSSGFRIIATMDNNSGNISDNSSNSTDNSTEQAYFRIELEKSALSLGEIGSYRIFANNNSNISITICPIAAGWVQCYLTPDYVNMTYPLTQAMPYSNKTGYYLVDGIMHYKNITIRANVTFSVANTLTAAISTSPKKIGAGDIMTFNATAAGGIAPYTYLWRMHDNTIYSGPGAYYNYTTAGSYQENLTVNDSEDNQYNTSIAVNVRNYYALDVIITDNTTGSKVEGVTVSISDDEVNTSSSGEADFRLLEGSYDVYVSKDDYGSVTSGLQLDEDTTLYTNMTFIDVTPPDIQLLTDDNSAFPKDMVPLKFKAHDATVMTCSLFVAQANDSWFALKDSGDNLLVDTEYTFSLTDLSVGAYKWRIECLDKDKNKATSEEREFTVIDANATASLATADKTMDEINTALDNYNSLSGDEADVVDTLSIKDALKEILDKSNNLDRDITSLTYRRDLDEAGRQQAQQELVDTIETMKLNTPISIKVTDSKTFVKYIKDPELKSMLDDYTKIKNLNLNSKQFLESTKRIQSKAIISTKVRNVILYYIDGRTSELTLVTRAIAISTPEDDQALQNSNTASFIELIPKSLTPDAKELNILNTDYKILKSDPMIEFPASTRQIAYYINRSIDAQSFEQADTVLLDKNINIAQQATGLSVLGIDTSNITMDGKTIMVIIVVVLLLLYLFINFGIIEKIRILFYNDKKRISYITMLVNDAADHLAIADYDKASLIYREIKLNYENCPSRVQKQVFEQCYELCNRLDTFYFNELYNETEELIRSNSFARAQEDYERLENTYNKIDENYKKDMLNRLEKIYAMLTKARDA